MIHCGTALETNIHINDYFIVLILASNAGHFYQIYVVTYKFNIRVPLEYILALI